LFRYRFAIFLKSVQINPQLNATQKHVSQFIHVAEMSCVWCNAC